MVSAECGRLVSGALGATMDEQSLTSQPEVGVVQESASQRVDVIVRSVGTASPRIAGAIARGTGIPIEAVVDSLYRAPARLVANLEPHSAEKFRALLIELGIEAELAPAGQQMERTQLFDVAAELRDPLQIDEVVSAVSLFLGCATDEAQRLLLEPPGVLLGRVSAATVAALELALPAGAVELVAVDPDAEQYTLFAAGLSRSELAAIQPLLPDGTEINEDGTLTVFDLSRQAADSIWRRARHCPSLRVVHQAFLRFDISLQAAPVEGAEHLSALAGVPTDLYPQLLQALPVVIEERLRLTEVRERMLAYASAGFRTAASLTTFSQVSLDVLTAPRDALAAVGLQGREAPLRIPAMSPARARVVRAKLEARGASVEVASL